MKTSDPLYWLLRGLTHLNVGAVLALTLWLVWSAR